MSDDEDVSETELVLGYSDEDVQTYRDSIAQTCASTEGRLWELFLQLNTGGVVGGVVAIMLQPNFRPVPRVLLTACVVVGVAQIVGLVFMHHFALRKHSNALGKLIEGADPETAIEDAAAEIKPYANWATVYNHHVSPWLSTLPIALLVLALAVEMWL